MVGTSVKKNGGERNHHCDYDYNLRLRRNQNTVDDTTCYRYVSK